MPKFIVYFHIIKKQFNNNFQLHAETKINLRKKHLRQNLEHVRYIY